MAEAIRRLLALVGEKRLAFFERYLSLWVALCMIDWSSSREGSARSDCRVRALEFGAGSQINAPIAVLIWLMITPMMMKVDFSAVRNVGRRPAGLARHSVRELGGQALLHGSSRLAFLPARVFAASSAQRSGPIHCRLHHSCRGSVHGDGVRLEPPDRRRPGLHAGSGLCKRPDHAGAVRADRAVSGSGASSLHVPFRCCSTR